MGAAHAELLFITLTIASSAADGGVAPGLDAGGESGRRPTAAAGAAYAQRVGRQRIATVTRRAAFAAAHRLFRPDWDDERNDAVFGKCSNPAWHGHNYVLEVTVAGAIDPETGFVADLSWVKQTLNERIVDKVDHKNLNTEVDFLRGVIPTTENLAKCFFEQLADAIGERARLLRVRVVETENNSATYEES